MNDTLVTKNKTESFIECLGSIVTLTTSLDDYIQKLSPKKFNKANRFTSETLKERVLELQALHQKGLQNDYNVILVEVKNEFQSELDYLKSLHNTQGPLICKLKAEIERLTKINSEQAKTIEGQSIRIEQLEQKLNDSENKVISLEQKLEASEQKVEQLEQKVEHLERKLTDNEFSALRRQIAIMIEFEIKKRLLAELGRPTSMMFVKNSRLFDLYSQLGPDFPLPEWNIHSQNDWEKFMSAMFYLKLFSHRGAHPVPITTETAYKLIDEPFDVDNSETFAWDDDLRAFAKTLVRSLAQKRGPNKPLLSNC